MSSFDIKPRFKEKAVRTEEIQTAAKRVFVNKGFVNTSMDEIAAEAHLSKGTIYLYFKNKDDLYVSLMLPVIEVLGEHLTRFAEELESGTFTDKEALAIEFYRVYSETYQYDPDGMRIMQAFQLGSHLSAMSQKTLERINQRASMNYDTTRRLLRRAMDMELIRENDPVLLTDILWSLFIGVVQLEESKARITDKDHLDTTLRYAFELIAQAL